MPLPFILGGLAVASVATGVKKSYDGHQDKSQADDLLKQAKSTFELAQKRIDTAQEQCMGSLEKVGNLYLNIGQDFNEFKTLAQSLIDQVEKNSNIHLDVNIPQLAQAKIDSIAFNAATFASKMAGGAVAGVASAYAVYGGVMSLAAASTGTAISSLSGVAAYNATLAAIGGGSIASGGFGMAVGAKILGGVVAAPIALAAGFAYASYGAEALKKARESLKEAENYAFKSNAVQSKLTATKSYLDLIEVRVSILHTEFQTYLEDLKIVELMVRRNRQAELEQQQEILRVIENGYAMAAILADIITTPLFKVKKDGMDNNVLLDDNKAPILLKDEFGLNLPNQDEMNGVIDTAEEKSNNIKG